MARPKDRPARINYGNRAPVPHYVPGMKLVRDESGFTYLVPTDPKDRFDLPTVFPNKRLAERAVVRTRAMNALRNGGNPGPELNARQVF